MRRNRNSGILSIVVRLMANPSAAQFMSYLGTLNHKPVRNRRGENKNPEVDWFYGDKTHAEPWCAIHLCFACNHFPGLLASVGGKTAVAYGWEERAPEHGKWFGKHRVKDAQLGDFLEMDFNHRNGADHTEAFVKRIDSEHFLARGGNVGGDNAADNVRAYADMYGFFRPKWGPVDHTVYSGVLYVYRKGHMILHSENVRELQKWLNAWGYKVVEDSYYGPKTAAAVKAFQKDHKLEIDGKVGPKTWAALKKPPPK